MEQANADPVPAPAPEAPTSKGWQAAFRAQMAAIRAAGEDWSIRWHKPEGQFVSALLGAMQIVGDLSVGIQSAIDHAAQESRAAAEAELAKARALRDAAMLAVAQLRNTEIALKGEQETVVVNMIDRTLPLFVERLEKVLVIKEHAWNANVKWRRYSRVAAVTLGIFLAGFGVSWWQDSGRLAAMDYCWTHPVQAGGHTFCQIDGMAGG